MKKIHKALFLFILLLNFNPHLEALSPLDNAITVNKESKILTAPEAVRYQWFFNHKKLNLETPDIRFLGPGTYTVEMEDKNGLRYSKSVVLALDSNGKIYKIYTIGDSTVQDYAAGYYPRKGWGQVFQAFFDSSVVVTNKAVGGTSAKSFYNGFWTPVKNVLQEGDYVFIQFGINDAHTDTATHTDPFTTFQGYLTKFVNETKALGAHPILVATLRRNAWNATNPPTLYDAYHDYPIATRQLAQTLDVPLVDLDQLSKSLMESLGPDYTGDFMYMHLKPGDYPNYPLGNSDDVHFQEMGAIEMARLVVQSISGMTADTNMSKLIPHINPMMEVSASANFPEGAILTRTAGYPKGLTLTLKAKMNSGFGFIEWQDSIGTQLTTNEIYSFVMDTLPLKFKAILDDDPQNLDCTGKNNGTAYIDECGECVEGTSGKFPCNTQLVEEQDTFKIRPVHSNLCVQETATITQESCTSDKSQSWIVIKEGNFYKIQNASSGLYIGADQLTSGTYLAAKPDPIIWRFETLGSNTFFLIPASNTMIAADVYGASTLTGKQLLLYNRNSNNNQKFKFILDAPLDCNGEPRGTATKDSCGICSGGSTGVTPVTDPELCPTGINENKIIGKYTLAPNPFSSETLLTLNNEYNKPYTLLIYNLQGAAVMKINGYTNKELLFGNKLRKGLYTCKIIQEEEVSTFKILKN